MYPQTLKKRTVDELWRISSTDYVRTGLSELERKGYRFDFRNPLEAKRFRDMLNNPENTRFKSMRDLKEGFYFWDKQEVDFVLSNLGHERGAIFYFRCNRCRRRVKYLYESSPTYTPLCRKCCYLSYYHPTKRGRTLSKIFRKPYFSTEDKRFLIKRAGITIEDFIDTRDGKGEQK